MNASGSGTFLISSNLPRVWGKAPEQVMGETPFWIKSASIPE
jgi:hypothetical protein